MKLVISDQKTGKSYSKTTEDSGSFVGKKIGETVELSELGLSGYTAKITGGSDKQGFPMLIDLAGTVRKRVFLSIDKKKGLRKRISRRGNTVSQETAQLNLKVVKHGPKTLSELISPEKKEDDSAASIKEKMIKESLETAGTSAAAEAMSREEFKKGERKR